MKVRSAGGRVGRPKTGNFFTGFPSPPRGPSSKQNDYVNFQKQKTLEQIQQSDRYLNWSNTHMGGGQYDFMVHDYLAYEKKLTEGTDFTWLANINGVSMDFFFPVKAKGWNLTSRNGFSPRQTLIPVEVSKATFQTTGIDVMDVYIEDLSKDTRGTLADAWAGIQRA